jgi:hypothetical protein
VAVQRGGVTWRGDRAIARVRGGAVAGLSAAGEHILGVSVLIVPLDENPLMNSGAVGDPDEDNLTIAITFDTPYAVRQHEELEWRHAPGRQAKYLEEPLHTENDTAQALIAASIRRVTR